MRICIAGKNQIAINAVKYLIHKLGFSESEVLICINKTDNGINSWQPSLRLFAENNRMSIVTLDDIYNIDDLVFFSLEFDRIINPEKFITKKLFNIHFSLLPAYKGMYTSVFPLLDGEKYSGVSLHKIDEGIDTGDIIAQKKFKINIHDTCRDLYFNYLKHGEKLFTDNVANILNEQIYYSPQNYLGASYYSKNSIDFSNITIDLNKTSFQIHNQIRAFIFPEYQLPEISGRKIIKSYLTNEKIKIKYYNSLDNKIILSGIDGYKIILETL